MILSFAFLTVFLLGAVSANGLWSDRLNELNPYRGLVPTFIGNVQLGNANPGGSNGAESDKFDAPYWKKRFQEFDEMKRRGEIGPDIVLAPNPSYRSGQSYSGNKDIIDFKKWDEMLTDLNEKKRRGDIDQRTLLAPNPSVQSDQDFWDPYRRRGNRPGPPLAPNPNASPFRRGNPRLRMLPLRR